MQVQCRVNPAEHAGKKDTCQHHVLKGSYNMNTCLKKQKAAKKKDGSTDKKGKEDSKKDPPSTKENLL